MTERSIAPPRVAIVLLNCNRNDDTRNCIRSLQDSAGAFDVILVDNGTTPNPQELYKTEFPDVVFLRNEENLGTPKGNNVGIRYALEHGATYILMLNNDTTVDKGFLWPLVNAMEADRTIGVAGGKIYYHSEPKRIWFAGGRFNRRTARVEHVGMLKLDSELSPTRREDDFISGCFAMFRASVLNNVGLLDEQFFAYMEDVDLNLRIKNAGYRLVYVPEAFIYHKISTTIKVDSPFYLYFNMRNKILMVKKHCTPIERVLSAPYLTFFAGRQLIRLTIKWRNWPGAKAIIVGVRDGLRSYTANGGKGSLDGLSQ